MIRLLTAAILSAILAGCASYETTLTNSTGQKARCKTSGTGIISSVLASSNHSDCVASYEAKGYSK